MPALDQSASKSALSLLNGIDYAAVIGAPLQAAIKAQAMAARSTWEFIQEVGLNTDEDGNKTAVNVEFVYQKDGEMVRLLVPLLTIVPIPCIVVTDIEVNFKASINAEASQSTAVSESEDLSGSLGVQTKIGWGPFSVSADFKASYSSKKDSKATQDSRYSVEYTQDVRVRAEQADMPQGLSTVLGILSSATTGASLDGDLRVSPPMGTVTMKDPLEKQSLMVRVRNADGLNAKEAPVTLRLSSPELREAVIVALGPTGARRLEWSDDGVATTRTGKDGRVNLLVWLTDIHAKWASVASDVFEITVETMIGETLHEFVVPFRVLEHDRATAAIEASAKEVDVPKGGEAEAITLTAQDAQGEPVAGAEIHIRSKGLGKALRLKVGESNYTPLPAEVTTGEDGKLQIILALDPAETVEGEKGMVHFESSIDGDTARTSIRVNVTPEREPVQLLAGVRVGGPALDVAIGATSATRALEPAGRTGKRSARSKTEVRAQPTKEEEE